MVVKHGLTLRKECRLRVFENTILRRIFGPKRDSNEQWRRLLNKELPSLNRSPNIVRMINSRRLRSVGHVARIEKVGLLSKYWQINLKEKDCQLLSNANDNDFKKLSHFLDRYHRRKWLDEGEKCAESITSDQKWNGIHMSGKIPCLKSPKKHQRVSLWFIMISSFLWFLTAAV